MILTFEDKIASQLREHAGPLASTPNETRAEFIQSLVQQANAQPNPGDDKIRFRALLPHSTFTAADLTLSQIPPASAFVPGAPAARKNPNKLAAALGAFHQGEALSLSSLEAPLQGVEISITQGMQALVDSVSSTGALGHRDPAAGLPPPPAPLYGGIFGGGP